MKSILIVTATLMTAASVYGVVDYNNKSGTKEFKELYKNELPVSNEEVKVVEEKKPAVVSDKKNEEIKTIPEKKAVNKIHIKKKKKSQKFSTKSFSRSRLG